MDDAETEIEFLESDDPDGRLLGGSGPAWHRPAAFLLALGLAIGGTTAAGVHAYRRDQATERAAAELVLREVATGDPVLLPNATSLGVQKGWTWDPSTTVQVDVINLGPDPVTLVQPATMRGPGVESAGLVPGGDPKLNPGQIGHLVGPVRVDCTLPSATSADLDAQTTLLVRARLANGGVGTTPIGLNTGGESVRDQICLQQGAAVAAGSFAESADPNRGTFDVSLTARSLIGEPLSYTLVYQYADVAADEGVPDLLDATLGKPAPFGTVTGILAPGARLSGGFVVPVTHCPIALPEENVDVELQLVVTDAGRRVLLQADRFDLSLLAAAACGQFG
jgi:hypothetical protein